jgi:hypothetical protein
MDWTSLRIMEPRNELRRSELTRHTLFAEAGIRRGSPILLFCSFTFWVADDCILCLPVENPMLFVFLLHCFAPAPCARYAWERVRYK